MKTNKMFIVMMAFAVLSLIVSITAKSQDFSDDRLEITFDGDRAVITQKNATANAAIGELVDHVRVMDFVSNGEYLYAPVYDQVWCFVKEDDSYKIFYSGSSLDNTVYANFTDAKKAMKLVMRNHYKKHGTLNAS